MIHYGLGAWSQVGMGMGTGVSGGVAGNGLLNNLVAYWPLNEAAGITAEQLTARMQRAAILTAVEFARAEYARLDTEITAANAGFETRRQALQAALNELVAQANVLL